MVSGSAAWVARKRGLGAHRSVQTALWREEWLLVGEGRSFLVRRQVSGGRGRNKKERALLEQRAASGQYNKPNCRAKAWLSLRRPF
ncbi:hypothetical protein NDU88_004300 [Pleurodeles waltl]|uniref:Uncharacterized protein n=1 Tax=Pleurodeles waltl TaxID=8319 RepID=A0AAV7TS31_PLEWA|nr:hypothetical protein NDU88_004300 [Pleurodeles waltl]